MKPRLKRYQSSNRKYKKASVTRQNSDKKSTTYSKPWMRKDTSWSSKRAKIVYWLLWGRVRRLSRRPTRGSKKPSWRASDVSESGKSSWKLSWLASNSLYKPLRCLKVVMKIADELKRKVNIVIRREMEKVFKWGDRMMMHGVISF